MDTIVIFTSTTLCSTYTQLPREVCFKLNVAALLLRCCPVCVDCLGDALSPEPDFLRDEPNVRLEEKKL
jgi:hypothetical protein